MWIANCYQGGPIETFGSHILYERSLGCNEGQPTQKDDVTLNVMISVNFTNAAHKDSENKENVANDRAGGHPLTKFWNSRLRC